MSNSPSQTQCAITPPTVVQGVAPLQRHPLPVHPDNNRIKQSLNTYPPREVLVRNILIRCKPMTYENLQ